MKCIGQYKINKKICDSLIELHKECDKMGLVVRGRFGKDGGVEVDTDKKDSYDVGLVTIPDDLQVKYKIPEFFQELKRCVDEYFKEHPILKNIDPFHIAESPIIQHYKPGGGFKLPHMERTGIQTTTRMLTWMAYLNTVTDGGGTHFHYQDHTVSAKRGRLVVWPSDFTHTHYGVVSPTQDKYIITGWLNFAEV